MNQSLLAQYINGHVLHDEVKDYHFFDYEINEALHLSPKEEQIVWGFYESLATEYQDNPDEFSRELMLANIGSILKYAKRFYKRQFLNRAHFSGDILSRFNNALANYAKTDQLKVKGLSAQPQSI